jgi:hypothetical protein
MRDPHGSSQAISQRAVAAPTGRAIRTQHRGVRSTRTAARFNPLLPFDDWVDFGAKLGLYSNATAWWLGDWLAFGQLKYGRRYKTAIAVTGLDYQTLRNYAVVSRRFEMSRRRDNLTFQHHAEVCALSDEEQDYWLDRAAAEQWSRNHLRRQLRRTSQCAGDSAVTLRLTVESRRARSWQEAAERDASTFEEWATRLLDDAATAASSPIGTAKPAGP